MRIVLQRVSEAQVKVEGKEIASIGWGLLALVGIAQGDELTKVDAMVSKVVNMRIFEDAQGKFNNSLLDIKGELLVVSQFTLYADTRKGRRPSFTKAMPSQEAKDFFDTVVRAFRAYPIKVEEGQFQAQVEVSLCNNGPVTILLDTSL